MLDANILPLVVHLFGRQQTNHAEGPDGIRGEGGDGSWFTVKEYFFDGIQPRDGIVLREARIRQRDGYRKSQPVVFLVPPDTWPLVFQVLADPIRRRIVELLGSGERPAGEIAQALHAEFGISQPATSRHLRLLRESGVAVCITHGTQRRYHLDRGALDGVAFWLEDVRSFWRQRLDALDTELFRGKPVPVVHELNEEDVS